MRITKWIVIGSQNNLGLFISNTLTKKAKGLKINNNVISSISGTPAKKAKTVNISNNAISSTSGTLVTVSNWIWLTILSFKP